LSKSVLRRSQADIIAEVQTVGELRSLGDFLNDAFKSGAADALFDMRDTLLHRGRPPRNYFVGGRFHGKMTLASNPKATPGGWVNDFVYGAASCDEWASWLERLLAGSIDHLITALEASHR
jgi:hypothetical protein